MDRCEWCGAPSYTGPTCQTCGAIAGVSPGRGEGDFIMKLHSLRADITPTGFEEKYLKAYDPRREGTTPTGVPMLAYIEATEEPGDAIHFEDMGVARREWMRWDGNIRPDGQPSRPLLAYNVEITREGTNG